MQLDIIYHLCNIFVRNYLRTLRRLQADIVGATIIFISCVKTYILNGLNYDLTKNNEFQMQMHVSGTSTSQDEDEGLLFFRNIKSGIFIMTYYAIKFSKDP